MSATTLPICIPRFRAPARAWAGAATLFVLGAIAGVDLITALLLGMGGGDTPLARFASDFRAWCFFADARTGRMNWVFPAAFFAESLLMAALAAWLGGDALKEAWRRGMAWKVFPLAAAALASAAGFYALTSYSPSLARSAGPAAPEFPADELRVSLPLPAFALTDQRESPLGNADLQGKVTVIAPFYAHCFSACPVLLAQVKRAVETLPKETRGRLQILGVTLDPEKDRPAVLAKAAADHGLDELGARLATGEPAAVNKLLDALGVERRRDPATGIIDHPGVLYLIGTDGRIAYRFSVGDLQGRWMAEALRILLRNAENRGGA